MRAVIHMKNGKAFSVEGEDYQSLKERLDSYMVSGSKMIEVQSRQVSHRGPTPVLITIDEISRIEAE